ncbi:MAG: hypothetical protein ACM3NH_02735 [Candidatus Saccharibacteria bacterium]
MEPKIQVSQSLFEYLLYVFPRSLQLLRGERRHDSERLRAWQGNAVFLTAEPFDKEAVREAICDYYAMAGFSCSPWSDFGINIIRGERWEFVLTMTVVKTSFGNFLFITVLDPSSPR